MIAWNGVTLNISKKLNYGGKIVSEMHTYLWSNQTWSQTARIKSLKKSGKKLLWWLILELHVEQRMC